MAPDAAVVPMLSTGATDGAALRAAGIPTYGILPLPLEQEDELRMHGGQRARADRLARLGHRIPLPRALDGRDAIGYLSPVHSLRSSGPRPPSSLAGFTVTSITREHSPSIWETVKEAVRGSHQDYTEAPIGRAVVLLAVPMVLEMLMESVFVVADVFFVGRLGADAVATVGITESLMTIMYALAIGLSIGGAATVARRIGEKDADGAAKSAVQSIILGLVVAAVVRHDRRAVRPAAARADGRERRGAAHGLDVFARDARRQRNGACCCS